MLQGVLLVLVASGIFTALSADLFGAMVLSLTVAMGAASGKLAFDALVQRDAPDANHGRSFARFEARFQIAWVLGAFLLTDGDWVLTVLVPIAVCLVFPLWFLRYSRSLWMWFDLTFDPPSEKDYDR